MRSLIALAFILTLCLPAYAGHGCRAGLRGAVKSAAAKRPVRSAVKRLADRLTPRR